MAQLMEHYRPAMCRVARQYISRTLQTQLDSVDLVQSVQVLLWLGLRTGKFSVDSPQGLLSLAKTLLQRKVARYCRNAKPHLNATIEGSLEDTLIDQALFPVPTETDPRRETEFEDLVEHFLNRLGDLDRQLVNLRFQGYSTAEAARHLNVDPSFLRVRLGRLRKRFAEFRQVLSTTPVRVPAEAESGR